MSLMNTKKVGKCPFHFRSSDRYKLYFLLVTQSQEPKISYPPLPPTPRGYPGIRFCFAFVLGQLLYPTVMFGAILPTYNGMSR
jgi:hypothetical protein